MPVGSTASNERYTRMRTLSIRINHIKRIYHHTPERTAELIATDEAELKELEHEEESTKLLRHIPLCRNPNNNDDNKSITMLLSLIRLYLKRKKISLL
jgi:hypothetical protein